jgi:hypothetical protein
MSKVISNIGHSPNQPELKTWTVPDGGESFEAPPDVRPISPDEVNQIRARLMQRVEKDSRVDIDKAKKRVDIITGIGRLTRTIPVNMPDGDVIRFSLRTLKGHENNDLAQFVEKAERAAMPNGNIIIMPTSLYKIRMCSLKYSLYAIDDVDIDVVIGSVNLPYEDRLKAREALLHEMDDGLTGYLYTQYDKLTNELIDGYIARNESQAKEAADAIHKSGA